MSQEDELGWHIRKTNSQDKLKRSIQNKNLEDELLI